MNIDQEELTNEEIQDTKESFSKSLFYIQLISLILAIISFFLIK